jgi:hypothetical protein
LLCWNCGSGLRDQGNVDWRGFEEQGDLERFAGFGGLQGIVFAGDDCRDGQHAVVGEAGDFGFEVAGYHVAELAHGVVDDVWIFGGFGAGHFGGEADGGVCGTVDGGDAAEDSGHTDHGSQAALLSCVCGRFGARGAGGHDVRSEAGCGHHLEDFERGALQDRFPRGIERNSSWCDGRGVGCDDGRSAASVLVTKRPLVAGLRVLLLARG